MVTKSSSSHETEHAQYSEKNHIFVLLAFLILLNLVTLYFLVGAPFGKKEMRDSSNNLKQVLLDFEYEKVGGKENYEVLQKYSQMQIKDQIGKIKEFVNGGGTATPAEAATPNGSLTQDQIQPLLADAYLEGSKDATIVAIEYSDMECPFCMRQYHETKLLPALLSQYGDKMAVAFKNNRGVNHAGTEAKAIGALCAGKVGGSEPYNKFYKLVMDKSTDNNTIYPVSGLADAAKNAGVDVKKWQSCFDAKETMAQFTAQTSEAQRFGLGGTPGTLLINVKNGKYATVEGAYPYATFTAKIDELLK